MTTEQAILPSATVPGVQIPRSKPMAQLDTNKSAPTVGYAWFVVAILMIAYVFSFIDRQILALLVKPIRTDLGISDTQMSLLMGFSFALFYSILGIPLG